MHFLLVIPELADFDRMEKLKGLPLSQQPPRFVHEQHIRMWSDDPECHG
jgi:hypothetical protein